jgi:hypothetical protein
MDAFSAGFRPARAQPMSRPSHPVVADTCSAFDVRMRTLLVLVLVLQAIPWPSHAALVTANASCAAAWIPEPSDVVRWSRIDATQGVLTIGTEIVARLDLLEAGIALRARDHPGVTLPGAVVAEDDETARLKVDARLPIDSSCVVSIRGLVERSSDSRLADQAAAWMLAGDAADAEAGDEPERASQLAMRALQALSTVSTSEFAQKLEFTALAVERLLRAGHRDTALQLLSIGSEPQAVDLPDGHPSKLRFELARARAWSFSDRNEEALGLRLALQPKVLTIFGSASDESLANRLRIANLRLELGDYRQARVELESLRESINRVRNPGDGLRISTIRALANALALLDLGKDSVELLDQLRVELIIAHGQNDGRVIDVEEQIARMQTRLEQFEAALQGASRVFLWRTGNLGFSNVQTLQSAWMLALLYKEFGRYDTARALVTALLEESNRVATTVPTQLTLRSLSVLGSIEGAQGNVDAAEEILRSAWRQYAAIVGENSDDTARALMSYALLLIQNGRCRRYSAGCAC